MYECVGARQTREKNTNRTERKWSMKAMRISERIHTASVDIGLCALDGSHVCQRQRVLFVILLLLFSFATWNGKEQPRVSLLCAQILGRFHHFRSRSVQTHMCACPFTWFVLVFSNSQFSHTPFSIYFVGQTIFANNETKWHLVYGLERYTLQLCSPPVSVANKNELTACPFQSTTNCLSLQFNILNSRFHLKMHSTHLDFFIVQIVNLW